MVILRFVSRRLNHEVGADDWVIFVGLLFEYGQYIANAVLTCVVGFGGYQTKDLSTSQFETFLFVSDGKLTSLTGPLLQTLKVS